MYTQCYIRVFKLTLKIEKLKIHSSRKAVMEQIIGEKSNIAINNE